VDLINMVQALSEPSAYLYPVNKVEVRHTHISVVFLAGNYAYKIKKPVELGFLDFGTLEKRRRFCNEEVRLNRRLAPGVYLGVVPVASDGPQLRMEGQGEVVDWAVKMERLPERATLESQLQRGEVDAKVMEALGRKVAWFHAQAQRGEHISAFGCFDPVARNARENYDQSVSQIGATVSKTVHERLRSLTEETLTSLRPLIEQRAARGVPRDTHGDLHLDHVYLFPDRKPPEDLVVIDCIEFNERFRFADPVADMAFLAMDLSFHDRPDLARAFTESYFQASGDVEGRTLLPFYSAYRAAVRAKVEGFELTEKEIPEAERAAALARARAHWLLALGELEAPNRRPCLVLVGGLPGTGKSTLARGLAKQAGFSVIRSDVVRKELAELPVGSRPTSAPFEKGIYTPQWSERTYRECLRRAEALLFEGRRVLVDAGFREEKDRRDFLQAAADWGVPGLFLLCQANIETVRSRLQERRDDASDAGVFIHEQLAKKWHEPSSATRQRLWEIPTSGERGDSLSRALEVLRRNRLVE
jgi:aminoglycoside phosphotransferase family enzyme/predicted kinase